MADRLPLSRRAVLAGLAALVAWSAGCGGRSETPEVSTPPQFGYGGTPVPPTPQPSTPVGIDGSTPTPGLRNQTPVPTLTPVATADLTPEATTTPTATPEPTPTPESTPQSTARPEPTPQPTATPEPTPQPTTVSEGSFGTQGYGEYGYGGVIA